MSEMVSLKMAVVGYYRWWLWFDGPEVDRMKTGRFSAESVRRIGLAYKVSRGIRVTGKDEQLATAGENAVGRRDIHADEVARLLEGRRSLWSIASSIQEKAKICVDLAIEAEKGGHTVEQQVSGMTKFMWFASPSGWTVFDQYSAKGAKVGQAPRKREVSSRSADADATSALGVAAHRATEFYARLERIRFAEKSLEGNRIIRDHGFGSMPMERIYDQELWLGGLEPSRRDDETLTYDRFLKCLPDAVQVSLNRLAEALLPLGSIVGSAARDHDDLKKRRRAARAAVKAGAAQ